MTLQSAQLHPAGFQRREHIARFDRLPRRFQPAIERRWLAIYRQHGRLYESNAMLSSALETLGGWRVKLAQSDHEICDLAKARAEECFRECCRYVDADSALAAMERIALRNGIEPPAGRNVTKQGQRARLLCEKWWRRALRRYVGRSVEGAAIAFGLVQRREGLYASHETVSRRRGQKRRNRALMESITAINEAGEPGKRNEYTLQELSDLGVSNPEIRRGELMTRLAGFDAIAKTMGHAGEFYTLTCPSKFHARDSISGAENSKYNQETPREAQAYLCNVWAKARAALHRRGVRVYGFRVCEPHHDGTPHWHMVLFMESSRVQAVRDILKKYAFETDGNEAGAAKHRFTAKAIDRSKGSAAGYLAKYISKNIDGFGVGEDWEAVGGKDDATSSAKRVDAWAACWGIRQFQQIGGAPVTAWRELRRLESGSASDALMAALIGAADRGDWASYTNLMGGVFMKRRDATLGLWREALHEFNAYGEPAQPAVRGVLYGDEVTISRAGVWVFKRGGSAAPSWSSVNNCTGRDENAGKTGGFSGRSGGDKGRFDDGKGGASRKSNASGGGIAAGNGGTDRNFAAEGGAP
jgi:hypothetical protein